MHDRPAAPRRQDQSFRGGLPFGCHVLGLWKLDDVVPGGLKRHKLRPPGSGIGSSKVCFQPLAMVVACSIDLP
jgi:hypothetical protein